MADSSERTGPGRPLKEINKKIFEGLCEILCTREEIARIFECEQDTLNAWCKRTYGVNFSVIYEEKSAEGKASLRRKQYKVAMKGHPTMLIWLGKQWLGQRDTPANESEDNVIPAPIYTLVKNG